MYLCPAALIAGDRSVFHWLEVWASCDIGQNGSDIRWNGSDGMQGVSTSFAISAPRWLPEDAGEWNFTFSQRQFVCVERQPFWLSHTKSKVLPHCSRWEIIQLVSWAAYAKISVLDICKTASWSSDLHTALQAGYSIGSICEIHNRCSSVFALDIHFTLS